MSHHAIGAMRHGRAAACCGLLLGVALAWGAAGEQPGSELVQLINAHRAEPQRCGGRTVAAAAPLVHEPLLARIDAPTVAQLLRGLKERDHPASRVQVVTLSGPEDAQAAMAMLQQHHCRLLADPIFAEVGVAYTPRSWRLVFAQPLLAPDLGPWQEAGRQVLERVNAARAAPRRCGEQRFEAAGPLQWNERLAAAARAHSQDMASRNYFGHRAPDGSQAAERARQQGYRWQRIGENIASGQGSVDKVVAGWLASPPHCRNLMNPEFAEMGAAYAMDPASDHVIYWTQVFGTSR